MIAPPRARWKKGVGKTLIPTARLLYRIRLIYGVTLFRPGIHCGNATHQLQTEKNVNENRFTGYFGLFVNTMFAEKPKSSSTLVAGEYLPSVESMPMKARV